MANTEVLATTKLHKGKGSVLTKEQVAAIKQLRDLNKTQAEIALAVGCDQSSVSRWLSLLTDTTDLAAAYLRGSALRMAKNVVTKGQARDHIQALKGLNVLEDEQSQGITVHVGRGGMVNLGTVVSPPVLQVQGEGPQNR